MTMTLISIILILVGIGLLYWHKCPDYDIGEWAVYVGVVLICVCTICLVASTGLLMTYKKDDIVYYEQLVQEREVLEQVLETGSDLDKIAIRRDVIDYNNKIISIKVTVKRFIMRDYWNQDLDWEGLQIIEWRSKDDSMGD